MFTSYLHENFVKVKFQYNIPKVFFKRHVLLAILIHERYRKIGNRRLNPEERRKDKMVQEMLRKGMI
jgi:hypothetical protein